MTNKERIEAIRNHLASTNNYEIDRWGHAKHIESDYKHRYKFMTNVIRLEKKVRFEATQYSPARSEWFLVKSLNVKKVYDNLKRQGKI